MKNKFSRHITLAAALLLVAGLVPDWTCGVLQAQEKEKAKPKGTVTGTVKDTEAKPWPDITLSFQDDKGGPEVTTKTDAQGKYRIELPVGTYVITVKQGEQDLYAVKAGVAAGAETPGDFNFKDPALQTQMAERKKEASAQNKINNLKQHYQAGTTALTQADALHNQLKATQTPDQKAALQAQIDPLATQAVSEFKLAIEATSPTDINRATIYQKIGVAYEIDAKYEDAAKAYEQAVALKPDAGTYNNLGNMDARLGRIDDATAAYQKGVDLDPANAGRTYLNFGITLYNANRLKEAIAPLKKATELDPKNAQAWYLLGAALVGAMDYKQEGDKITPVMQPGTVEAYQTAIDLDPSGTWGEQAKQGIEALKQLGLGIDTKEKVTKAAKPVKH